MCFGRPEINPTFLSHRLYLQTSEHRLSLTAATQQLYKIVEKQISTATHPRMSDNKVSASAPIQLPTEIWLQIIGEFLTLPDGIHSDRWPSIKKARVDKMSIINREFSSITPEAF
jgi:hypothetical protein